MAHLAQLREIARPLGIGFLGLGMSPKWTRAQTPVMPKSRYKIMTAYMPKVGTLRPRHDVPHLHGADESRLLLRSRHGEEAARLARAAAGRDRAVRELAVHRRQAERLSVVPLGSVARHRQPARRHAAVRVRGRHGLRALCRLRARRADVFRQARGRIHRHVRPVVPRPARRASCPATATCAPRSRTGRTTSRRFFPRCG